MPHINLGPTPYLRETATTPLSATSYTEAEDAAMVHVRGTILSAAMKTEQALIRYGKSLSDRNWKALDTLLTSPSAHGHVSLANPQTRYRIQRSLVCALLDHYHIFAEQDCRTYLSTFCWDAGATYRDAPIIPITLMRMTVHRTLRGLGLCGIGNMEFDVFARPLPGETERRIFTQAHINCWTTDRTFRPQVVERALNASGRFPNMVGIKAVDFCSRALSESRRNIRDRELPDQDQTPRSIAHLGYYITKAKDASLNLKAPYPGHDRPSLLPDTGHFKLIDALRLADLNSHFTPKNALFAFGQGNEIKRTCSRNFRGLQPSNGSRNCLLKADHVSAAFAEIWAKLEHAPTQID